MRAGASWVGCLLEALRQKWAALVTVTVADEDGCDLLSLLDEMLTGRNIISWPPKLQ